MALSKLITQNVLKHSLPFKKCLQVVSEGFPLFSTMLSKINHTIHVVRTPKLSEKWKSV